MLEKNLKSLGHINPVLKDHIDKSETENHKVIYSDNKTANLLVKSEQGVKSAYPLDSPKRKLRALLKDAAFNKEDVTIVVGIGVGHLCKMMLDKMEKRHVIIIIEPEIEIYKKALQIYDFTKWLDAGSLYMVSSIEELTHVMVYFDANKVIEHWRSYMEGYCQLLPEIYNPIIKAVGELTVQFTCSVGTRIAAGAEMALNDIVNLPYIFNERPVNEIKNAYENKPAVIVSTGPSLEKNIHQLIGNEDKIIIIAVAQSLRILTAYGIKPDFITSVDYGTVNEEHFAGLMDSEIPFVAFNRVHRNILKKYKGPKYIAVTDLSDADREVETAQSFLAGNGSLLQGGSVSHFSVGLASHLGCNPIALIGQDLALTDGKSHNPLADAGGSIDIIDGEIFWNVLDERSSLQKEPISMGAAQYVEGYFGGDTITTIPMGSFITSMVQIGHMLPNITKFNCTEGGAFITGFENKSLKEYLEKCPDEKIKRIKHSQIKKAYKNKRLPKLLEIMENDLNNIYHAKESAEDGLETLEFILKAENKSVRKKWLDMNNTFSKRCHAAAEKNPLLSLSVYKSSRLLQSRAYKEITGDLDDAESIEKRVKSNRMILEAVVKESNILIYAYKKAYNLLNHYIVTKDEKILHDFDDEDLSLKDAEKFFDAGNWARPLLIAKKLLLSGKNNSLVGRSNKTNTIINEMVISKAENMRDKVIEKAKKENSDNTNLIRYSNCVRYGRTLGKAGNFKGALPLLKEAVDLFPDKFDGRYGYATVLNMLKEYEESEKIFQALTKEEPANLKLQFELGQVVCNIEGSAKRGLQIIAEVMTRTDEFNYYLYYMAQLYIKARMSDDAIYCLEIYIKSFADNRAHKLLSELYYQKDDSRNGIKYKTECIKLGGKI